MGAIPFPTRICGNGDTAPYRLRPNGPHDAMQPGRPIGVLPKQSEYGLRMRMSRESTLSGGPELTGAVGILVTSDWGARNAAAVLARRMEPPPLNVLFGIREGIVYEN